MERIDHWIRVTTFVAEQNLTKDTVPVDVAVDIIIPRILQDAMSREAQAERERRARVLLSQVDVDVAMQIVAAARGYENNPMVTFRCVSKHGYFGNGGGDEWVAGSSKRGNSGSPARKRRLRKVELSFIK